jgi:hypothetical protein
MLPAIPALAMGLLKSRALWYAVGITAVVATIFIGGCNYGASGKAELQAEFDAYKKEQAALLASIQHGAKQDALKANDRLKAEERALEENHRKQRAELAKLRKELDAVKLSADVTRLFNESVRDREPTPPPQEQANGSSNEVPAVSAGPPDHQSTLGDLVAVSLENNKNHLACIAQVQAWQDFYIRLYERFE